MVIVDYYLNEEDKESGIVGMGIVSNAAILEDDEAMELFNQENKEDYIFKDGLIHAPILIPNRLMERYTPDLGIHFGRFNEESIKQIHRDAMKKGTYNFVNFEHDKSNYLKDIYLHEVYEISDRNESKLFPHLPNGTIIGTYAVDNEEAREKIKSGNFQGLSIELKKPLRRIQDEVFKKVDLELEFKNELTNIVNTSCLSDKIKEDLIIESVEKFETLSKKLYI